MAGSGVGKGENPDRWRKVDELLSEVLQHESGQRVIFLEQACADDEELKKEVETLLREHEDLGTFLDGAAVPHDEEELKSIAGRRIGSYRLLRKIGQGGMGTVYLAERADGEFRKRVALKVIKRGMDTEAILKRFRRERQILASLQHPNIAVLFDGGTSDDGLPYFVMEYVEGQPINEYCDSRRLPIRERLILFCSLCSAVHYAHENQVVHRDLKPGNVLVTAQGIPKLVDFGIAKLVEPDAGTAALELTHTGVRPMTPAYASPEQVLGKPITASSDIYSLGVLLYQLLSGRHPSPDPRQGEARFISQAPCLKPSQAMSRAPGMAAGGEPQFTPSTEQIGHLRSSTPAELRHQLSGDLDTIVLKAMHLEPERRYLSAGALSDDIERHLRGLPILARKDSPLYRARKYALRHKAILLVTSLALLFALGAWRSRRLLFGSLADRRTGLIASTPELPKKSSRADAAKIRQLTKTQSCPFAPIYLDSETVAYDIRYGAQWGLYALDIQRGLTRPLLANQLAYGVSPGRRPGELFFTSRETGPDSPPKLAYLDLQSGARSSSELPAPPAAVARGAIYYPRPGGSELRRFQADRDEAVTSIPPTHEIFLITPSPDQSRLALLVGTGRFANICFVELAPSSRAQVALQCPLPGPVQRSGRISFSPDSGALYYPTANGIRRYEIASKLDEEVLPDVFARGGLSVSPDGKSLVYSDCRPRGPLWDISVKPLRLFLDDELAAQPVGGPDGLFAYVRDREGRSTVVVRNQAGVRKDVSARVLGKASTPSIDSTGRRITFVEEGAQPGIYVVDADGSDVPKPLTSSSSDSSPVWTRDGRIVFNRWAEPHIPYVYLVDPNTTEARQAHSKVRRVRHSNPKSGLIVLSSQDERQLYLWDFESGIERPVSLGHLGTPLVSSAALLPGDDSLVVQVGADGRNIWKVALGSAANPPEKIFTADGDPSMSSVAVLSDGRIVVGVRYWLGELHLLPARTGETF